MTDDHLPEAGRPDTEHAHWVDEEPRRFSGRARIISWIAGIVAVLALIGLAVWLSHGASSSSGGQGGGGRHHPGGSGGGGRGGGGPFSFRSQTTTVGTAKAATADLPVQTEALGTVTPAATVTVIPQVSGTITQILFQEGQKVSRGQALAIIDPRPYKAALLQAQGTLVRDRAQLENAKLLLKRYDILNAQDSIARQDRDTQAATVHQLEGTVMTDQGAVQAAQVNLGFTRIVSPVSGRIGLRVVDIGNYVSSGTTGGIAVVTTLQPIDVEFAIPQQQAPSIEKRIAQGASIPALALDSTRTQTLDTGKFSTLNNQVDTTTGTIKGKARFPNNGTQLYPSQFVNVRLTIDTVAGAITVPPSAVRTGPDGDFVWLLKPDRTVTQRVVKTGVNTADKIQITTGLAVGDTVVTDGGDRLTEGAKVALPGDNPQTAGGGKNGGKHHRRSGGNGG
ncbi:efflux RND transporter periplasmic adaptor subunit [Sphingomonas sp. CGMCC 1.13654]|uniref:Efflux RND transporter periplasmic adaptor subunit n=1 Tax=Sphingomonas chungangi TaxID=2683589 RepID=A0A838LAM9_9SPHN|nr:efflux RND transporter periplasmic adaptor subunit [Sphingomonas chungangi]MBA2936463.1 efflux RND transporter periplasmic adaptor subunit [Sphingomonas chungangi]MVW55848.1 efflux RND transporter periplasmic adaptor subunit [Sphingomonas chungangi]